jgi:single-stranded-DNA-specific exonuclease
MKKKILRHSMPISASLQSIDLHPILRQVYANRGINSPEQLETDLSGLLPFHDLSGIDTAVTLLFTTIYNQQRILIVGDYDADGATSTVLMMRVLRRFGAKHVDFLVPNRFEYGYGLTPAIVKLASKSKPDLIITVDNGISSIEGVKVANELGIKVIVTDHHLPDAELPQAAAIVNPNQPNDKFASKNLAGVGVAFYVLLALRAKLREESWFVLQNINEPNLADYLDLVALGTVADVVALDKNNRILVHQGLRRIKSRKGCMGIFALLKIANRSYTDLAVGDLGFAVGPRLNAAGRLDDMALGINCLLTDDYDHANKMARELNELNNERRVIEQEMRKEALSILSDYEVDEDKALPFGLCLHNENWHQGVVGIVASRLKDRLHRPVVAFALQEENLLKGSARSVPGLHVREVISEISIKHPGLIVKFGGHAMAAGLNIAKDNYSQFAQLFDEEVRSRLNEEDLQGKFISDGKLEKDDLSFELAELLRSAGPWGQGFSEPLFDGKFRLLQQRIVGDKHLKLRLELDSQIIDAIAFNVDIAVWPNKQCENVYAVYRLGVNEYLGKRSLQLVVECLEMV